MTKEELFSISIDKPLQEVYDQVKANWDCIAKPLDGLGEFETMLCKVGAIQTSKMPMIHKRAVIMMIGDNGVVEAGVSQSGQDVTFAVAKAMGAGTSSVCKMARVAGADTIAVDVGINSTDHIYGLVNKKVALGTKNFAKEAAMTPAMALSAIEAGISVVADCKSKGYTILATGEMGIGNTTTSTALAASLLRKWDKSMTGRGAGLTDAGLSRKTQVINDAVSKYDLLNLDAFDALCAVGGLDIAGLCGVFIGGAIHHIPIVIDGAISGVSALLAEQLVPGVNEYMLPSHQGKEPIIGMVLKELGLTPVIGGNLALGEGTGAVMLFPLLDMAMALYEDGNSFGDIAVEQYVRN